MFTKCHNRRNNKNSDKLLYDSNKDPGNEYVFLSNENITNKDLNKLLPNIFFNTINNPNYIDIWLHGYLKMRLPDQDSINPDYTTILLQYQKASFNEKKIILDNYYLDYIKNSVYSFNNEYKYIDYTNNKNLLYKFLLDKIKENEIKENKNNKKTNIKQKIPKKIKQLVWNTNIGEEFGISTCLCCNNTKISQMDFQCGHIISEKNGGTINIDNLKPICLLCNTSMGIQNMNDFILLHGLLDNKNNDTINDQSNNYDKISLHKKTIKELNIIAKNNNMKKYSKLTKNKLIDCILLHFN